MAQLLADFFAKVTSLLFEVNYKFNNGNFAFIITYIKQLLDEVEHDIMNYQNRGLCSESHV